jgi:hypothetical protein
MIEALCCPMCGAHVMEWGEGETPHAEIYDNALALVTALQRGEAALVFADLWMRRDVNTAQRHLQDARAIIREALDKIRR